MANGLFSRALQRTGTEARGLARSGLQGATFGLSDEALGLLAAQEQLTGPMARGGIGKRFQRAGEAFTGATKEEREKLEKIRERNPAASRTAEIAGALLTGGPAALSALRGQAPRLQRALKAGKIGTGQGAAAGFGTGQGIPGRLLGLGAGGVIGGLFGLGGPFTGRLGQLGGKSVRVLRGAGTTEAKARTQTEVQ